MLLIGEQFIMQSSPDAMIEQARGKMTFTLFSFNKERKAEEAIELLKSASNLLKTERDWDKAGATYEELAELQNEYASKYDSATSFVEASMCFKNAATQGELDETLMQKSVEASNKAVRVLTLLGKHHRAAKTMKTLAESYEESENYQEAINAFLQAQNFFESDGKHPQQESACKERIAHLSAQIGEYIQASDIFEEIGRINLKNRLLATGAKKHFYKAVLCRLAGDDCFSAESKLRDFLNQDYTFPPTREAEFLNSVVEHYDQRNSDGIALACEELNRVKNLSDWETKLMTKVKKNIAGEGLGGGSFSPTTYNNEDEIKVNNDINEEDEEDEEDLC